MFFTEFSHSAITVTHSCLTGHFFSDYLLGKDSWVTVRGMHVETPITWVQKFIKILELTTVMPGAKSINLIEKLEVNSLALSFQPQNGIASKKGKGTDRVFVAGDIVAHIAMPFGFPFKVIRILFVVVIGFRVAIFFKHVKISNIFLILKLDRTIGNDCNHEVQRNFCRNSQNSKNGS